MESLESRWQQALAKQREQQLFRQRLVVESPQQPEIVVEGQQLLSFCSNDYLGLANHPEVKKAFIEGVERYGCGSGASHLVSGHTHAHEALEEALAAFTGRERALVFSSGYMANVGTLTCLAGKQDRVFEDRLNHASLLDGGLFSGAQFARYRHGDSGDLARRLEKLDSGVPFIVTDGVFSMDGDMAPVSALAALAAQYRGMLMVDDAHGFGCLGRHGGGTLAWFAEQGEPVEPSTCQILIGTLGKAFGTAGAFVAGRQDLIEMLVQFCRPYIYTTAQPAALAWATLKSLELLQGAVAGREWLAEQISDFRRHCQSLGFELTESATPIQGLILGSERAALEASSFLSSEGLLVTAIRPPTVPKGTARLRITFTAAHTRSQFERLLSALSRLAESGRVAS